MIQRFKSMDEVKVGYLVNFIDIETADWSPVPALIIQFVPPEQKKKSVAEQSLCYVCLVSGRARRMSFHDIKWRPA